MEFLHAKNDTSKPVDSIRVNWFYRPKDIARKSQDTRMLFATMHSDISPLNTLRGKCTVKHKAEIPSWDEYRKNPDCFWWDKMYDRYIQKNYDAIPTSQIKNVPERVKKVLDERWKYILVEQGRGKELTMAVKSCKRCSNFAPRYVPKQPFPTSSPPPLAMAFLFPSLFLCCCCSYAPACSSYPPSRQRVAAQVSPEPQVAVAAGGAHPRVPVQADQAVPYRCYPTAKGPQGQVPGCRRQYALALFLENSTAPHGH